MKVLIALQEKSETILKFVRDHRWEEPVQLHVVHVIELPPVALPGYHTSPQSADAPLDYGHEVADYAAAKLKEFCPAAKVTTSAPIGRPADLILEVAQSLGVDVIVMGARGRGAVGKLFLGSVSTDVLSKASCAVLVVASPKHVNEKAA